MKIHGWLLLLITANIAVGVRSRDVVFVPKALDPDLNTILQYHSYAMKNGPAIKGYIQWPQDITFVVQRTGDGISNQKYLKIEGKFTYRRGIMSHSYDGLYRRNDGLYYVKESDGGQMRPVEEDKEMYYIQPDVTEKKPYVSIRYMSLTEQRLRLFDTAGVLPFGEVNQVRALYGKIGSNKVKVSDNAIRYRQEFLAINPDLNSGKCEEIKKILGITQLDSGYLTEVLESDVRILGPSDYLDE